MLMAILIRLGITALAFVVTAWLLSGMELSGGFFGALWVALIFGVINTFLGTIIRLLTFPLIMLTLGLFAVLINAFMLWLTDEITRQPDDRRVLVDDDLGGAAALDRHGRARARRRLADREAVGHAPGRARVAGC